MFVLVHDVTTVKVYWFWRNELAPTTISQLMVQQQKRVWFTKTRHPETNSSPYKIKVTPVPVYLGMKLLLHSTSCITKHWEKGGQKWDIWNVPRNIGSSQSFHIGAECWSRSWAFFSSLNNNNNKIIHKFSVALVPAERAQRACSHTCT